MAQRDQKDLLARLADAGEEAIHRLSDIPGGARFMDVSTALRTRMDELQKKVRGIDALERRVAELERRLDAVQKDKPKTAARKAPTRTTATATTARKTPAPKKPSA